MKNPHAHYAGQASDQDPVEDAVIGRASRWIVCFVFLVFVLAS